MTNQVESASQITIRVSKPGTDGEAIESVEIVVTELEARDEFGITFHHGSNSLEAAEFSMDTIEHNGNMRVKGHKRDLNKMLFYQTGDVVPEGAEVGAPRPFTIDIIHMDDAKTTYGEVRVLSRGFQFSGGESAETGYEWAAMSVDETDPVA